MVFSIKNIDIFTIVCLAVGVRSIISLHYYSGAKKPPMFGDFEAQRHWQEITLNVNIKDWYTNTTDNDLSYWGLDYPPLTAYHSYAMGTIGKTINDDFVKLYKSRGIESPEHKGYMRLTVLFADIFVYVPAILSLGFALEKVFNGNVLIPFLTVALMYPGQMLIDNGHFQYNNISLGLAALAITGILRKQFYYAAIFFSLALNYKQMELYHSLPFFAFMLRYCFQGKSFMQSTCRLAVIGGLVLSTFALLWMPWCFSLESMQTLIRRLFPIGRGVFEDKVANVWCALNVIIKLRNLFTNEKMAMICLVATVLFVLPINIHLFVSNQVKGFLYALTNTAMAFFMFSFHVHEKTILLVSMPAICLLAFHPQETLWFLEVTTFSMLPLLIKDQLTLPYFAMFFIYHNLVKLVYGLKDSKFKCSLLNLYESISRTLMVLLSVLGIWAPSPSKYPYLWPLLVSLFSCAHFILYLLRGLYLQMVPDTKPMHLKNK